MRLQKTHAIAQSGLLQRQFLIDKNADHIVLGDQLVSLDETGVDKTFSRTANGKGTLLGDQLTGQHHLLVDFGEAGPDENQKCARAE